MYDWDVNNKHIVKAYVRYGNLFVRFGPYYMDMYAGLLLYGTAAVRMPVKSASTNRHEWLIRGENVKLCVWFGDFFIVLCAPFVALWGLVRQAP